MPKPKYRYRCPQCKRVYERVTKGGVTCGCVSGGIRCVPISASDLRQRLQKLLRDCRKSLREGLGMAGPFELEYSRRDRALCKSIDAILRELRRGAIC